MKKMLLLVIFVAVALSIKAQQATRQSEFGLITDDFDVFGLSYMTGTNASLWRFSASNTAGSVNEIVQDSSSTILKNNGLTLKLGKEFRKSVAKNIEFRYGLDVSVKYSHSSDDYSITTSSFTPYTEENSLINPGLNLVFGFNYVIKNRFVIGAEINPGMNYWFSKQNKVYSVRQLGGSIVKTEVPWQSSGIGYTLSNIPVLFTLSYRLFK